MAVIRAARKAGPCRVCGNEIRVGEQFQDFGWQERQHIGCEKPRLPYVRMATFAGGKRKVCRLYNIWEAMRKRCHRPSSPNYQFYGAKGIRVCVEWYNDYDAFRAWAIANGYRKDLTLDRIRNAEGYGPNNCRWATREEQTYNSSRVHSLTLNGVTKLLPIWAKELGFSPFLLRTRRSAGWTDEQILTTPMLRPGEVRQGVQHKPRGRRPKAQQSEGITELKR